MADNTGIIRIGTGGWVFEPWRGAFYPEGLAQSRELAYAASKLTSIEINSTYYGSRKPSDFVRWREATPPGFVFAVKAPRAATQLKKLAGAGEAVERFFASGVTLLGEKLGPVNWQFPPSMRFDPDDFAAFLELLPRKVEGRPMRHAVEVRHKSFLDPDFVALARRHGVAVVLAADSRYPRINDLTAPFVYARLMGTSENEPNGYPDAQLDRWAALAKAWAQGAASGLATLAPQPPGGREVFLYVIRGFKERNPRACMELIRRVKGEPPSTTE